MFKVPISSHKHTNFELLTAKHRSRAVEITCLVLIFAQKGDSRLHYTGCVKKMANFFASMNAFTDWAEILYAFNITYFSFLSKISSWFIQWFRSYTYFRKTSRKTRASCFTAWRSIISSKKNANSQCCTINIVLLDSKHQLHSLFDIVFSKKAWVSSKRCGNRKVGEPPASSARLAKISVTPKPLNESTINFRQEWIISYIKCMQNFSSIGKGIHARKKNWPVFLTHPVGIL